MEYNLEHRWKMEYAVDEGVVFDIHLRLELYHDPDKNKFVVCSALADFTTGRHWNKEGPPDKEFDRYQDALRAYQEAANKYAPTAVKNQVRADVERKLKSLGEA